MLPWGIGDDLDRPRRDFAIGKHFTRERAVYKVARRLFVKETHIEREIPRPSQHLQSAVIEHHIGGRPLASEAGLFFRETCDFLAESAERVSCDFDENLTSIRQEREAPTGTARGSILSCNMVMFASFDFCGTSPDVQTTAMMSAMWYRTPEGSPTNPSSRSSAGSYPLQSLGR